MSQQTIDVLLIAVAGSFAMMTGAVLFYARRIALHLGKVAGVEVTADQLRQLDAFVTTSIHFVEERVHQYVRGLAKSAPATAEDKRTLAIQTAREIAPDDLKGFTDEAIGKVIDAKIHAERVGTASPLSLVPPPPRVPSSLPPPTAAARILSERPEIAARATPIPAKRPASP